MASDPTYPNVGLQLRQDGSGAIPSGAVVNVESGGKIQVGGNDVGLGPVVFDRLTKIAKVALANVDTGGGVFAWANPESVSILITKIVLDVTTKATGACSLDIGTTATNANTQSDNLADGLDVGTAAGLLGLADQAGANGKAQQKLAASKWVTASKDSGASAGLVGFAYIHYHTI